MVYEARRKELELVRALKRQKELESTEADERTKVADVCDRVAAILSDVRDGTYKHLARYDSTLTREYFPVGEAINTKTDDTILALTCTNTNPTQAIQPASNIIWSIYGLEITSGAWAAPRQVILRLADGVSTIVLHDSVVAAGETHELFPYDDINTVMRPSPLKITNSSYLEISVPALAVGETLTCRVHRIAQLVGGLRT